MIDLRSKLPRANWSIGTRSGNPTSITLHYFGPGAPNHAGDDATIRAMAAAARNRHMAPKSVGGLAADGLQYHYFIPASGQVYQARDERAILWHCANATGNSRSIAVNLPLDSLHDATDAQWSAFGALCDKLIARYRMAGRPIVLGHREWPRSDGNGQSPCPGPKLTRRLQIWRGQLAEASPSHYRITVDTALIRQGPGQAFKVALNGSARLHQGDVFTVDSITIGTPPKDSTDPRWLHLANHVGFIHFSLATPL
jgi:hypothetical protein